MKLKNLLIVILSLTILTASGCGMLRKGTKASFLNCYGKYEIFDRNDFNNEEQRERFLERETERRVKKRE